MLGNPGSEMELKRKHSIAMARYGPEISALRGPLSSRATLIVVPTTLIDQWSRELRDRVLTADLAANSTFQVANVANRNLSEIDVLTSCVISGKSPRYATSDSVVFRVDDIKVGWRVEFRLLWAHPTKVTWTNHHFIV